MKKKNKIINLEVDEISLVDNPANKIPFLIVKRSKEGLEKSSASLMSNLDLEERKKEWGDIIDVLYSTISTIAEEQDDLIRQIMVDNLIKDFKKILYAKFDLIETEILPQEPEETIEEQKKEDVEKQTREENRRKQLERAKKWGIEPKEGGNITKPSEFANIPDEDFADPVNYKYPIDEAHIRAARVYSARGNAQKKGGYTDKEWKIITDRIEAAAKKFKIGEFAEKQEKIQNIPEKVSSELKENLIKIYTTLEALEKKMTEVFDKFSLAIKKQSCDAKADEKIYLKKIIQEYLDKKEVKN